jgi:hypothetical protein
MAHSFFPTRQDVERYQHLRAVNRALNAKMLTSVPEVAYTEIGDALGLLHKGILVLESEDMSAVLADCCLYNWFENGKNLVQQYAELHPPKPDTDESYLLGAASHATYRILKVESVVPGAGICC